MLQFLVDEDLPRSLYRQLLEVGLQATDVRDVGLHATPDEDIFRWAVANGYTLISADMGFSNILSFPLGAHHGIVVARIPNEIPLRALNRTIVEALLGVPEEDLRGNLLIVEPHRFRLRKAQPD